MTDLLPPEEQIRQIVSGFADAFADGYGCDHHPVGDWCGDCRDVIAANVRRLLAHLATVQQERDEYRTLAAIGVWHEDCRPNRHMAARELAKSQAVIDKLADTISAVTARSEAAEHDWQEAEAQLAALTATLRELEGEIGNCGNAGYKMLAAWADRLHQLHSVSPVPASSDGHKDTKTKDI